jgi:hypothetical protein
MNLNVMLTAVLMCAYVSCSETQEERACQDKIKSFSTVHSMKNVTNLQQKLIKLFKLNAEFTKVMTAQYENVLKYSEVFKTTKMNNSIECKIHSEQYNKTNSHISDANLAWITIVDLVENPKNCKKGFLEGAVDDVGNFGGKVIDVFTNQM